MEKRKDADINNIISTILGDIQRIIIYPQLGWSIEDVVPEEVINAYFMLKSKGYNKFIFDKDEIQQLITKYGLVEGKKANYFN